MKKIVLFVLILTIPVVAFSTPTPEVTKEVVAYYLAGSTPVLVEVKFCSDIQDDGASKNECVAEVDPAAIAQGDTVYIWMNFMVPKNAAPSISILFNRNNRPASSATVDLKPSLKSLTWAPLPTSKAGSYSAQIDLEVNDNFDTLKSLDYQVK